MCRCEPLQNPGQARTRAADMVVSILERVGHADPLDLTEDPAWRQTGRPEPASSTILRALQLLQDSSVVRLMPCGAYELI